jgi:cell pole-organizing protein PopZ
MSPSSEPQNDPTMEEILASIRKIISEEQTGAVSPRVPSFRVETVHGEVLELTDEIPSGEDRPDGQALAPVAPAETRSAANPEAARDPLLSDSSSELIGRAFDSLDSVFERAVQEAVSASVQQWVSSHEAELINASKPMLREWMDNRLPGLVENVLKQELGRAVTEHLRRRLS